jgi:hypothetical protein
MGEYVKHNGTSIKLGTCEDLYYARFNQIKNNLAQMTKVDGNDEPAGYLNPANGYRYRFPFPDEDNLKLGNYENFDRGLLIGVAYDVLEGIEHDKICQGTACQGGYNVNHYITCPADPAFVPTCNPRTDRAPVEIVQQKQVEGRLWTVCRCGWCQAKFRLPKEKAEILCASILEQHQDDGWQEVMKRIMGGYEMTL